MANYVHHTMTISGNAERLDAFCEKFCKPKKEVNSLGDEDFLFSKLSPTPEDIKNVRKHHITVDGVDKEVACVASASAYDEDGDYNYSKFSGVSEEEYFNHHRILSDAEINALIEKYGAAYYSNPERDSLAHRCPTESEWVRENWGAWPFRIAIEHDDEELVVSFETKWTPAEELVRLVNKVACKEYDLHVKCHYTEETGWGGTMEAMDYDPEDPEDSPGMYVDTYNAPESNTQYFGDDEEYAITHVYEGNPNVSEGYYVGEYYDSDEDAAHETLREAIEAMAEEHKDEGLTADGLQTLYDMAVIGMNN